MNKAISLTIFDSTYDNKVSKSINLNNFNEFETLLYSLSKNPGYKPKKGEWTDKGSKLISPAVYKNSSNTRCNANVSRWDFACIDVDDHNFKGDLESELKEKFGQFYYVCYSTASSTKEFPKFRLVFPLTKSVEAEKIKHFWFALNKEFDSLGDAQTKDLSRMFYVPGQYPNAYNFIFTNKGNPINPDVFMRNHEYVEKNTTSLLDKFPKEIAEGLMKQRKNSLTNTNIHWSSYIDCPFVNKKQIDEFRNMSDGDGRYFKLYQIMVSIASSATLKKYPIVVNEIVQLCKEIDLATHNNYQKRPLQTEASRALDYVISNNI